MKKPELTDMGWLGPKDEMDRASHLFGKCSECREIICVEKAKADRQRTGQETREVLDELFRTHLKLKHSEDRSHGRCIMRERPRKYLVEQSRTVGRQKEARKNY